MSVMSPSILPSRSRRITAAGFDPLTQPIVQSTALQALAPSSLEPDFIRSAFSCQVKWQVDPVFPKSFQVDSMQPDNVVHAAVLFPLVQRPSGLHVLITPRASPPYDHAGQISFQGGRLEHDDRDAGAQNPGKNQSQNG